MDAYVRMRQELDELRSMGRERVAERLLRAREFGDIRENAEYDAAKDEQALMEARIRDLEYKLKDPDIIEVEETDEVIPGTLVTLRPTEAGEDDGRDQDETYLIALSGEERAPGVRTVTSTSPLGAALLGKRVGERVTYEAPGGVFTYRVISLAPYRPS